VLLIGPTGSGKTLLAKTLARILNVPFAIGDATTLTEAATSAEDVENILTQLLQNADYDLESAQRGIVYIDEIDKIGKTQRTTSASPAMSAAKASSSFTQDARRHDRQHPPARRPKAPRAAVHPDGHVADPLHLRGTFVGLEDIIRSAWASGRSALAAKNSPVETARDRANILAQVQPEDLVEYGMIPEFVGRLPISATLEPLDVRTLINILTQPKNALVKQYQKFFRMEGSEVEFTPGALEHIAERALKRDTGARALRAVCEEIMLDLMYRLPDEGQGGEVRDHRRSGGRKAQPLRDQTRNRRKESA